MVGLSCSSKDPGEIRYYRQSTILDPLHEQGNLDAISGSSYRWLREHLLFPLLRRLDSTPPA